jgi:preprotein translocase subunit SecG
MPVIIIVAGIVGAATVITLVILTRGRSKKIYADTSDRDLIEAKMQNQSLVRTFFVIQMLLILLFTFVCLSATSRPIPDAVVALFIFFLCVCVGLRGTFKSMKIAAAAELEFRKLSSSSGVETTGTRRDNKIGQQ